MNRSFRNVATALAFATAASGAFPPKAVAADSTSNARFADQFAVMQSLSSNGGPTFQLSQAQFSSSASASARLNFGDMQAAASNSAMWQPQVERPSMIASAPVPSGGLSVAYYQALSGNSSAWQLPASATGTAYAAGPNGSGTQTALSFSRRRAEAR